MRLHQPSRTESTEIRRTVQWAVGTAVLAVMVVCVSVGSVTGQELPRLGHPPTIPLEQAADVIVVLKPHVRQFLDIPTVTDRVIQGDIVRLEKGVVPTMIVHTRNTFTSPLEANVPVKLYLKEFRDGHGHYIIGVDRVSEGGRP